MLRILLFVFVMIFNCHCQVYDWDELTTQSPEKQVDQCGDRINAINTKVTKLLDYHQGSVPELLRQVKEKDALINRLNVEIIEGGKARILVNQKAIDAKEHEQRLFKTNELLQKQLNEANTASYQEIKNILNVSNELHRIVGSSLGECSNLQVKNNQLELELKAATFSITQLTEKLTNNHRDNSVTNVDIVSRDRDLQVLTTENVNLKKKLEPLLIVEKYRQEFKLSNNNTDLMSRACWNNRTNVVAALLQLGVDCNSPDADESSTCLHSAAYRNHVVLAKFLLDKGCAVNPRSVPRLSTPLMSAAVAGNLEVGQVLLEGGADVNAKDSNGLTAMRMAKINKRTNFIQLLKKYKATE